MKRLPLSLSLSASSLLLLHSCKENPDTVEITEQRELCKFDENEMLRRIANPFTAIQPLEWRRIPRTDYRKLNYRAGQGTQVSVSTVSGGGISANAGRWYGEFNQQLPDDFNPSLTYPEAKMFNNRSFFLIEVNGNFKSAMANMKVARQNYSCLGILCPINDKDIITIKMTGPKDEVAAQRENFLKFATQLRIENTNSYE